MRIFTEIKDQIRNDLGAKIAGMVLMGASIVSVFVADLDVSWKEAMLPFAIGAYLAFRKTKNRARKGGKYA